MAESVLNQPCRIMETEVRRLDGASPGNDLMHRESQISLPSKTQTEASNDEEEDSIERDLRLMGIIIPRPEKPVAKSRRPKRSLKITLTGIKSDSLHEEEERGAVETHTEEERRQAELPTQSKTAELVTRSQTYPEHGRKSVITSTSQEALNASIIQQRNEVIQPTGIPSQSASSAANAGLPSEASSTATTSANKRRRASNGRWTSVKQSRSKLTSSTDEDVVRVNDASPTTPDMRNGANAIAQTRSGRRIHRPEVLVLEYHRRSRAKRENDYSGSSHLASARSDNHKRSSGVFSVAGARRQRSCRSSRTQGPVQGCSRCERTSISSGNLLVYCDKCNSGWHQFCHHPPIDDQITEDKHAPWICMVCKPAVVKPDPRNVWRRRLRKSRQNVPAFTPALPLPPRESSGSDFSYDERRNYLASLSHTALVNLLLDISTKSPDLLMFPQNLRSLPSVSFLPDSTPSTVSKRVPRSGVDVGVAGSVGQQVISDCTYGDTNKDHDDKGEYVEDHRLYPEPGNGFQLPPMEEDLHMLLEDADCVTFSHSLHGPAAMTVGHCNAAGIRKPTDVIETAAFAKWPFLMGAVKYTMWESEMEVKNE
ncbi:hypothetical protein KEM54_002233 [Ascosphaera aggregata]|nr:hypothetical protein KEM54_002233 [Ascosphaera aggregata]